MQTISLGSLYIETFFDDLRLMTGTGFIVLINNQPYLITNRHNFTGLSQDTNIILHETMCVPNKIKIYHHMYQKIGISWIEKFEPLYLNMNLFLEPLWIEHPQWKEKIDVVALKLTNIEGIGFAHYLTEVMTNNLALTLSDSVSILGFPCGINAGEAKNKFLPICVVGNLASEPEINIDGLPLFYVDCRARSGQSGSPVIAFRNGLTKFKNNNLFTVSNYFELLGIYSGRINKESDIGKVWKSVLIKELIQYIQDNST